MSPSPSRTLPFHSADPRDRPVFHTNVECDYGKRITPANWRAGAAEHPACEECARLNAAADRRPTMGPR